MNKKDKKVFSFFSFVPLRKTVFAIIVFFVAAVFAQADVYDYPLKAETKAAFEKTSNQFANFPFIKGSFEQEKYLNRLNRSLLSSGNFIIATDLGMVWDTLKPFPSTLVLGENYLVQSRPGGQKTVLSAEGNETFISMAEVISAVFSGNTKKLLENFEVFYSENGTAAGVASKGNISSWEIGLIPKDKTINSFAVKITMKGDSAIRSILINEQNGDSITYNLSNHSYPKELTLNEKSFFTIP